MHSIQKIADGLTIYATNGVSVPIPKVHFLFTNEPTDIPGIEVWKLKVVLTSTIFPVDEKEDKSSSKDDELLSWEETGNSDDECVQKMHSRIVAFLGSALCAKKHESDGIQTAIMMLKTSPEASEVWVNDPKDIQKIEEAADDQGGWTIKNDVSSQPTCVDSEVEVRKPASERASEQFGEPPTEERHFYVPPPDEMNLG